MCSNVSNVSEHSKKFSVYLAERNHKPKKVIRSFEKINNQLRSTVLQKREKSKVKPVIFNTQ